MNEAEKYKGRMKAAALITLGVIIILAGAKRFFLFGNIGYGLTLFAIGLVPILAVSFSKIKTLKDKIILPGLKNIFLKHKKTWLAILALVIIIFTWNIIQRPSVKILKETEEPIATLTNLPVWAIRDGEVAVAREINLYKDAIGTSIIVANLGQKDRSDIKIYDSIPKEIAQNAKELEFSHPVEIIKDDPLILWNIRGLAPGRKQTLVAKKKFSGKSIIAMLDNCHVDDPSLTISEKFDKESQVADEIVKEFGLDKKEVYGLCLKWWRTKYQNEQEKIEKNQQNKEEKIKVVAPADSSENTAFRRVAKEKTPQKDEETGIINKAKEKISGFFEKKKSPIEEFIEAGLNISVKSSDLNNKYFPLKLATFWSYNNAREIKGSETHCSSMAPQKSISAEYILPDKIAKTMPRNQQTKMFAQISIYDNVKDARLAANTCGDMLFKGPYWVSLNLDYGSSGGGLPRAVVYTVDNYLIYIPTSIGGWDELTAKQVLFPEFKKSIEGQY